MDAQDLRNAFRRSWFLAFLGIVYCLLFFILAVAFNMPEPIPQWDMDGKPFVPASSPFADGYPVPPHNGGQR